MKNLKDYRDKELKWFLLANILLMIISSGILVFGETADSWMKGLSSALNVTVFSSAIYILTFIFDSVVPSHVKVFLVFLWRKQPSATIFTDMQRKFSENRFTFDDAEKKYANLYETLKGKSRKYDQTALWYEIYNRNRGNTIVFGSNRDYLLLRDMHAQTIMLIIVYISLSHITGIIAFSKEYILYLTLMTILLNISARVQGKRLMYNVLSVDINKMEAAEKADKKGENDDK